MDEALKLELKYQIENKYGYEDGVAVKLEFPEAMNDISYEENIHKVGHRIWMLGEIEILNNDQVERLRKIWNDPDIQAVDNGS